jgi:very-short-patch-repair endonuclease
MRDHTTYALSSARRLRREMSLPEVLLWQLLRQRPLGVKFRRQHPIGSFVADFFCAEANVVIEIDGIAHDMGSRPERDKIRDAWLVQCGKRVVRMPAAEVLRDVRSVAESLARLCLSAPPPSGASHLPPPPAGEDFA